ncbi:hypothetical protein SUDANB96_05964 [Streptomyces sp. enrichment culture]
MRVTVTRNAALDVPPVADMLAGDLPRTLCDSFRPLDTVEKSHAPGPY